MLGDVRTAVLEGLLVRDGLVGGVAVQYRRGMDGPLVRVDLA